MPEIKLLDSQTIDKIAAGEVVEKPASVVKELVENAMDAHAKAITVEIKGGGIDLIRITDDGWGIPAEELPKAFLRHATSKIESDADLFYLQTLGFRGEALASISAVAQVEMITKTEDSLTGTRIVIEGGVQKEFEEIGAPNGTTILVRNLFYNTPARKKFLKSAMTEGAHIVELMQHMALSMPSMSFKLVVNNAVKFHTSGNGDLKEVIYRIYGRDTTKALIPVSVEQDGISIEGYLGKPELSRANRAFENYFVNRRYVRSNFISKGIEDGYKGFMMQHQFPFCVLHINVDTTALDVNVHPTKMQVRMSNQEQLVRCLVDNIRNSLTGREMIPEAKLVQDDVAEERITTPEPFEKERLKEWKESEAERIHKEQAGARDYSAVTKAEESVEKKEIDLNSIKRPFSDPEIILKPAEDDFSTISSKSIVLGETGKKRFESELFFTEDEEKTSCVEKEDNTQTVESQTVLEDAEISNVNTDTSQSPFNSEIIIEKPEQLDLFEEKILTADRRQNFVVLGQIFKTYWLIEYDGKLFFLDQHAAHEKVKFEEFMKKYREKEILSQNLSPAIVVSLSQTDALVYEEHKQVFENFGFEIESFGGDELMLRAIPLDLYGANPKEMFLAILEELAQVHSAAKIDIIEDRIATMACKAAVKGNSTMSFEQISVLLDQLLTLENPYQCPHGRPTMFSMTKYEIEKKFKRIV
ncbi:MAG: DNA mismatch repair endonuclease MutL [Lachnospiraceae bacterium]|nr:DNA mismatch repair endonuclease MutL [Lachnospiraceae bacterium]